MTSSVPFKSFFLLVALTLIKVSCQQELFEDAVVLEKSDPILGKPFRSMAEEYDVPDEGTSETADTPMSRSIDDDDESQAEADETPRDSQAHSYVDSDGFFVARNGIDKTNEESDDQEYARSAPYAESDVETTDTDNDNMQVDSSIDPDLRQGDEETPFMEHEDSNEEFAVRPHDMDVVDQSENEEKMDEYSIPKEGEKMRIAEDKKKDGNKLIEAKKDIENALIKDNSSKKEKNNVSKGVNNKHIKHDKANNVKNSEKETSKMKKVVKNEPEMSAKDELKPKDTSNNESNVKSSHKNQEGSMQESQKDSFLKLGNPKTSDNKEKKISDSKIIHQERDEFMEDTIMNKKDSKDLTNDDQKAPEKLVAIDYAMPAAPVTTKAKQPNKVVVSEDDKIVNKKKNLDGEALEAKDDTESKNEEVVPIDYAFHEGSKDKPKTHNMKQASAKSFDKGDSNKEGEGALDKDVMNLKEPKDKAEPEENKIENNIDQDVSEPGNSGSHENSDENPDEEAKINEKIIESISPSESSGENPKSLDEEFTEEKNEKLQANTEPEKVFNQLPDLQPTKKMTKSNKTLHEAIFGKRPSPLLSLPDYKPRKTSEEKPDSKKIEKLINRNVNISKIDLESNDHDNMKGDKTHRYMDDVPERNNKSIPNLYMNDEPINDLNGTAKQDNLSMSFDDTNPKPKGALLLKDIKDLKKDGAEMNEDDSGSLESDPSAAPVLIGESSEGDSESYSNEPIVIIGHNDTQGPVASTEERSSSIAVKPTLNEENEAIAEPSDETGSTGSYFSGDDTFSENGSGAERERREALFTEEQVNQAKAKLKNAVGASDALTNIEKEMGLDPSIAPEKTQHLTSELHNEIDKFKNIMSNQGDAVKRSKFQKLEKLAEEDVKGANDVMKMIVELEVAKYFAKTRARKKLELAIRNRMAKPPSQDIPDWNQYQNTPVPNIMPQFQEQPYRAPYASPYHPYAPQQPIYQPLQQNAFFNPYNPQRASQRVAAFVAPQAPAQDFNQYIIPMKPQNLVPSLPVASFAPNIPFTPPDVPNNQVNFQEDNKKVPIMKKIEVKPKKIKTDKFLPKSSPFAGLKKLSLSSLKPIHALPPSFSSEMKSQESPLSSLTDDTLTASSVHPFTEEKRPENIEHVKPFFPQSAWVPPARINTFSDGLSHLHISRNKPKSFNAPKPAPPQPPKQNFQPGRNPFQPQSINTVPSFQPPMQQQYYDRNSNAPQAPPMYPHFQMQSPIEPALPVQQYPQAFYPQPQAQQPMAYMPPRKPANDDDEESMDATFNDEQPMASQQPQGPQIYPQQPAVNSFNPYGTPVDSYPWPQSTTPQGYGYQPNMAYEQQLVNPLLSDAVAKIQDTQKAAQVVQKIENKIGLSPPAVSHIIDDVESETKHEKKEFDHEVKQEEEKIHNEKELMNDVPKNDNIKNKIKAEEEKLEDVRKRDEIAKVKLATIKKIEKILTVIESAKYSALKRAREHLRRLKLEKDPQIRKRSLEALEKDLDNSEKRHLHRRNEINIWLKGSRNSINTSHFLEGQKKEEPQKRKHRFKTFGSPSIPKLAIANFAAKFSKKAKLSLPKLLTKKNKIPKAHPKKQKIGVVLMRKLLQRMDDLYDMQSKILTQLVKEHQRAKDNKDNMRDRRSLRKHHHDNHRRHLHRRHTIRHILKNRRHKAHNKNE